MGTLQPWGHQGDGDTGAVGTPWGTVAVGTLWAWRHEWHGHGDTLAMEHGKAGRGQWPLGNGDHRDGADVERPRGDDGHERHHWCARDDEHRESRA